MQALALFLLLMWLACEINYMDMSAPEPNDPYRLERWRDGEGSLDS